MNKKILFISIFMLLITGCTTKKSEIPEYNDALKCVYKYDEIIEDENIESENRVYIYEKDGYIKKIIKQAIMPKETVMINLDNLSNLYNNVSGINSKITYYDNITLWEITYDLNQINKDELNNKLGGILDQESILFKNDLKVKLKDYQNTDLKNYKCSN